MFGGFFSFQGIVPIAVVIGFVVLISVGVKRIFGGQITRRFPKEEREVITYKKKFKKKFKDRIKKLPDKQKEMYMKLYNSSLASDLNIGARKEESEVIKRIIYACNKIVLVSKDFHNRGFYFDESKIDFKFKGRKKVDKEYEKAKKALESKDAAKKVIEDSIKNLVAYTMKFYNDLLFLIKKKKELSEESLKGFKEINETLKARRKASADKMLAISTYEVKESSGQEALVKTMKDLFKKIDGKYLDIELLGLIKNIAVALATYLWSLLYSISIISRSPLAGSVLDAEMKEDPSVNTILSEEMFNELSLFRKKSFVGTFGMGYYNSILKLQKTIEGFIESISSIAGKFDIENLDECKDVLLKLGETGEQTEQS